MCVCTTNALAQAPSITINKDAGSRLNGGTWIAANLGPRGLLADAGDGAKALLALARQAPEFAARAERLSREIDAMAEHGFRFDAQTATAIGQAEARATRWGRVALWVIAAALVWIAWGIS